MIAIISSILLLSVVAAGINYVLMSQTDYQDYD